MSDSRRAKGTAQKPLLRDKSGNGVNAHLTLIPIKDDFPIIPHESAGIDCCGCIVSREQGRDVELACTDAMRYVAWSTGGSSETWYFLSALYA
jgi:hypothetical protein